MDWGFTPETRFEMGLHTTNSNKEIFYLKISRFNSAKFIDFIS